MNTKQERFLRTLGVIGTVLFALGILLFGMNYLKDEGLKKSTAKYDVLFDDVATLNVGDPVKANGVKIGKVVSIDSDPNVGLVRVSVQVQGDFAIPQGSVFSLQNIGLLGERQIGIQLNTDRSQAAIAPGSTVRGRFTYGISEAMAAAGVVFDSAKYLLASVKSIVDSTIGKPGFNEDFHAIVTNAVALEKKADRLVNKVEPPLVASLKQLKLASVKANAMIDENRAPLRNTVLNAERLSLDAQKVAHSADSLAKRLDRIAAKLETSENTAGALLHDRQLYEDLRRTLQSTDSLMLIIINQGLDINVDLF